MRALRKDAEKKPIENAVIIFILAVGIAAFPTKEICNFLFGKYTLGMQLLGTGIARLAFSALMVFLVYQYQFTLPFVKAPSVKSLIAVIPCVIVSVNNAPFIALFQGTAAVNAQLKTVICFIVYCIGIGVFEEITFRGIIFPLCVMRFKDKKHGLFFAVVLSSAMFGLIHFVNLFGGSSVGAVLLQVGYSFLVGGMCAISLIITKSIYVPIALHTVYDVCGMIVDKIGQGKFSDIWNVYEIILTAVIAVAVIIYMIYMLVKADAESVNELYGIQPMTGKGEKQC